MVGALVIVFYSLVETGYIAVYKLAGLADAFKISDMFTINCVHGDPYASVMSFAGKISKFISGIFRVDLCEVFLRMFFKISFNSTSINPKIFSNLGDGHVFSKLYHFRNVGVFDFCIAIAKTSVALLVFLNSMFRHFKPKHAPGFSTGIVFRIQGVDIKLFSRNKQFGISNVFNDFKLKCVKTVLIKSSLKRNTVMFILS